MARPNTRSIHGTADHDNPINDQNKQVATQRNAFSGTDDTGTKGAFRGDGRSFNIASRGTGEEIMTAANSLMQYRNGNDVGSTPASGESLDFPEGQDAAKMLFKLGDNKLATSTEAIDNPNLFGPNTSVSNALLGNPQSPGNTRTSPATQMATVTEDTADDSYNTRGYGVSISRNDPRRNPHGTRDSLVHVARESSESTKLGEYIDSATYDYFEADED
jgi:hypothetical protein